MMILDPYRNTGDAVMLLNFDSSPVTCEVTGQTFTLTAPAALTTDMFTDCLNVNGTDPSGGARGRK